MRKSLFQRLYERALERYVRQQKAGGETLYRRCFERLIRWGVWFLLRWKRWEFPPRGTGGWWWLWRWKFEFLLGWFEQGSVMHCRRIIRPGMTVLDIGAHVGYYSRLFSKLVGPGGRVLALEASPENFAVLERNLAAAGCRNVEAFQCAASDRDGMMPLYISAGHSSHSLHAGYNETQEVVEVKTVRLDSFLAERGIERVDFVKSDTEGAEPRVFAGLEETLRRSPRAALLMEFYPRAMRCGGFDPAEFAGRVRRAGFGVQAVHPDGSLGELPEREQDEPFNILCQRE